MKRLLYGLEKNDVDLGHQFTLLVRELYDLTVTQLLVAGASDYDKSAFINSILGENILNEAITTSITFKDDSQTEITELTELDIRNIPTLTNFITY